MVITTTAAKRTMTQPTLPTTLPTLVAKPANADGPARPAGCCAAASAPPAATGACCCASCCCSAACPPVPPLLGCCAGCCAGCAFTPILGSVPPPPLLPRPAVPLVVLLLLPVEVVLL